MRENLGKLVLLVFICIFSITGCAAPQKSKASQSTLLLNGSLENTKSHYYIQGVPFVKQKGNLCGPVALSLVFNYFGKDISQEEIAKDIYLIPVHGVLNIDLENYAKDKGFWAYASYDKDISKIKDIIRKDIPVLVLVSSPSISLKNMYHYLVLLGYEDDEQLFIAHSGKNANTIIPYKTFLRNWAQAEFWSLVVCPKEKVDWELDAQGYSNLGILFEKEGSFDLALEKYKVSLDKSREPMTLFNLGNVYLKKKEYKEALSCYKEAVTLDPHFADCYNNLAYTYMEENLDLDEAMNYAKQALELKPANKSYYLDTLGMIQLKKELLNEAIKSFEEASVSAADSKMNSVICYHLGLAKLKAGLTDEAKKIFKKSIELDPQSEAKKTLENLL